MYDIYLNKELVYSGYLDTEVSDASLELVQNDVDTCEITFIPKADVTIERMKTKVEVYEDGDRIFNGIVCDTSATFYNEVSIKCKGEMFYLSQTVQDPDEYGSTAETTSTYIDENGDEKEKTETIENKVQVSTVFQAYLTKHNERSDEKFTIGKVDVKGELYLKTTDYLNTWDCISSLVSQFGGYLQIRWEDNVRYLDWLTDFDEVNSQTVQLAVNLSDVTIDSSALELSTVLIPLGDNIEKTEIVTNDDGDEVQKTTSLPLTIESVNNGSVAIQHDEGVKKYGRIWVTHTFSGVKDASELLSKAKDYLNKLIKNTQDITVKLVDLSHTDDGGYKPIRMYQYIVVDDDLNGIHDKYIPKKITKNLLNPSSDTIELTSSKKTDTSTSYRSSATSTNFTQSIQSQIANVVNEQKVTTKALETDNATIHDTLSANVVKTNKTYTKTLEVEDKAKINSADIKELKGVTADYNEVKTKVAEIDKAYVNEAKVRTLVTSYGYYDKAMIDEVVANYVQVDGANINDAFIEKIYSSVIDSKDLTVKDGKVTGTLQGVTILGDMIKGNTIKADRLIIKGTDGLYHALNTNGVSITQSEAIQDDDNSLNGKYIQAKSIVADHISVSDLFAFGATIGSFTIDEDSIRSMPKQRYNDNQNGIVLQATHPEGEVYALTYNGETLAYNGNTLIHGSPYEVTPRLGIGSKAGEHIIYDENGLDISVKRLNIVQDNGDISNIQDYVDGNMSGAITGTEYIQIDSATVEPSQTDERWSKKIPTWKKDEYIWQRFLQKDGSDIVYSKPMCIQGTKGDKGDPGKDAVSPTVEIEKKGTTSTITITDENGTHTTTVIDGNDGLTSYWHVKYSAVEKPTESSQISDTPAEYIGTYTDFSKVASTDPSKYTWSKFQGVDGTDGASSYTHIAYCNNKTTYDGFSTTDSTNKLYIGVCVDFSSDAPTDKSKYKWSLIKGDRGEKGFPGDKSYIHTAYANSADGSKDFSTTDNTGKSYFGQYSDFTEGDSTDYKKYNWTLIKGANGRDGISSYTHTAYADSRDGSKGFTTVGEYVLTDTDGNILTDTDGNRLIENNVVSKLYIGFYTDSIEEDSTDYARYSWSRIRGADGTNGSDGRTSQFHIKFSDVPYPLLSSQINEVGGEYIGTYCDYNVQNSNDPTRYTWRRFKGLQGDKGIKGDNSYLHIAYSDGYDSDGNIINFDASEPGNRTYMGTYTDQNEYDSMNPDMYNWSKTKGEDGASVTEIDNYYLATSASSGITTSTKGWTTEVQSVTAEKKYLWNYEVVTLTDAARKTEKENKTTPYIIGVYGDTGTGISSVIEHYALSTSSKDAPLLWQTNVPTLTADNKYLWNYETILYTDNTSIDTKKRVIGVYGDKGEQGDAYTSQIKTLSGGFVNNETVDYVLLEAVVLLNGVEQTNLNDEKYCWYVDDVYVGNGRDHKLYLTPKSNNNSSQWNVYFIYDDDKTTTNRLLYNGSYLTDSDGNYLTY